MPMEDCWGSHGIAVRATLNAEMPEHSSSLGAWILHIDTGDGGSGPHLFMVGHLRPVIFPDGNAQAPFRQYPEATHEMVLVPLDPSTPPSPDDWTTLIPIMPVSVGHHFDGMTDDEVRRLGLHVVKALVDGKLPPIPRGAAAYAAWETTVETLKEKITGRPFPRPGRAV